MTLRYIDLDSLKREFFEGSPVDTTKELIRWDIMITYEDDLID
jgi:hypothetical protein